MRKINSKKILLIIAILFTIIFSINIINSLNLKNFNLLDNIKFNYIKYISHSDYIIEVFDDEVYLKNNILRHKPFIDVIIDCNNPDWPTYKEKLNNEGFRGENISINKTIIGIFGDSYVYGTCMSENETIAFFLNKELNKLNISYEVFNFGQEGYNHQSTFKLISELSRKYNIKYSIIYDDDYLHLDISDQLRMQLENPEKYSKFKKNELVKHMYTDFEDMEYNMNNFSSLINSSLKETIDKNKIKILYYFHSYQEMEQHYRMIEILDEFNIISIKGGKFCNKIECHVPIDGHFNKEHNQNAAKIIANKIYELENKVLK